VIAFRICFYETGGTFRQSGSNVMSVIIVYGIPIGLRCGLACGAESCKERGFGAYFERTQIFFDRNPAEYKTVKGYTFAINQI